MDKLIFTLLFMGSIFVTRGQNAPVPRTLENALDIAVKNNAGVKASLYDLESSKAQKKTYGEIGKTNVIGIFGQYNSAAKADNNFTITQSIPFPTVFTAGAALGKATVQRSTLQMNAVENELAYQVKSVYHHLIYLKALHRWIMRQDSLFAGFERASNVRYRTGEISLIEKTTAETQARQVKAQLMQNAADIRIYQTRLQTLLNENTAVDVSTATLVALPLPDYDSTSFSGNPLLNFYKQQIVVADKQKNLTRSRILPDLTIGYFNQTLIGTPVQLNSSELATASNRFQGFQAGVSIPLWIGPHTAKVRAANAQMHVAESEFELQQKNLKGQLDEAIQEVQKYQEVITYYQTSSLPNADLLISQSQRAYQGGEIGYLEYLQSLRTATELQTAYINALNNFNQSVIRLEYLTGKR